ncbi:MAG TPA: response regulator, partial [Deltaproteobacteria bacterium]|nr:response regulator [Deltaproteobacteria bacterium]HXK48678.1 response regulator [Deltaproteobacteria bacterium]
MASEHILIVEDEEKIASLLRDYLEKAGYRASMLDRGDAVVGFVKQRSPDLILLDIMLPGMDGMEVCREVRKTSRVPVIMITARVEEIDRLLGLELGADDYVCKPFSPREVVARVRAVLRRVHAEPEVRRIVAGDIELDDETRRVLVRGEEIRLTPSEFRLLKVLISHPNRVFSRNDLVNQVQGYEFEGYDRTIDSHIKNLRRK